MTHTCGAPRHKEVNGGAGRVLQAGLDAGAAEVAVDEREHALKAVHGVAGWKEDLLQSLWRKDEKLSRELPCLLTHLCARTVVSGFPGIRLRVRC